jgi:GR25 family glycosyltransferase involved in LPS biosynthesis
MTKCLREAALRARAAGDHRAAMAAWRALLDQVPDDWSAALELKRDTRAAGQYPDNDARFRRAARGLPDETWLEHYSNLYAFHAGDLEAIEARATAMLARRPNETRLHVIRADVARQRRDWAAAAELFDHAGAAFARQAAAARLYGRLAARAWPDTGAACRVVVVNLDRNPERMAEMAQQLAGSTMPWTRHAGVDGTRIPGAAVARLTGATAAGRGTLGCFLSHAAVWEHVAAQRDAAVLVMEDDAIPLLDLPARLGGLSLPEGWDVVWVNDRMEPAIEAADGFSVHPLPRVMRAMHPENNACGTDGYLISQSGARKLLDWVALDGFADDVDWRMVAYGMTPAGWASLPQGHARRWLAPMVAANPRIERLAAYVLNPALVRTVGVSSDREDGNRDGPGGASGPSQAVTHHVGGDDGAVECFPGDVAGAEGGVAQG